MKIRSWVHYSELLLAVLLLVLGIVMYAMMSASAAPARPAALSSDAEYTGPFITVQHVPAACITSITNTRYYNDPAPSNATNLRTGGHGHGGHLKCIYYFFDGPPQYTGDHVYGKWLILPGLGPVIPQPDGLVIDVQNCFSTSLPYHFPSPNDCGEDYLTKDGQTWHYGHTGLPMFPAATP